jgi:hypothetical protein
MLRRALVPAAAVLAIATGTLAAQQNRIDTVAPSAPELAGCGTQPIGVRCITVGRRAGGPRRTRAWGPSESGPCV